MPRKPSYPPAIVSIARAVVTINGRDIYLGGFDNPESRQAYDRIIGEWLAAGVDWLQRIGSRWSS